MVPSTILRQLGRLRIRERLLRCVWGVTRCAAVFLAVLAVACLADWVIDRFQDTPWSVRYGMFSTQIVVALAFLAVWVAWPLLRRLADSTLALWVEDRHPGLNHRLISTVQLNQKNARTQGMSQELIGVVTKETERQTAGINFAGVADHRRLTWAAGVLVPPVLIAGLLLVLFPNLVLALLERQMLRDREIPRLYALENVTKEIWPANEEVTLRFLVKGPDLGPDLVGTALVFPDGQYPYDQYPLEFEEEAGDGQAYFVARVPFASADFSFRAYIGDARSTAASWVRFVARPSITQLDAWVLMNFNRRGDRVTEALETKQERGDLVSLPGQEARVKIATQKAIKKATLELLGHGFPDLSRPFGDTESQQRRVKELVEVAKKQLAGKPLFGLIPDKLAQMAKTDVVVRSLDMPVSADGLGAAVTFDLRPTETSYRVTVLDEYDHANVPPPVRTVRVIPEDAPQVALLPEIIRKPGRTGSVEDSDQSGMPVPPGLPIQVAYHAVGPYSLGKAILYYRVIKKAKVEGEPAEPDERDWLPLPLLEAREWAGLGRLSDIERDDVEWLKKHPAKALGLRAERKRIEEAQRKQDEDDPEGKLKPVAVDPDLQRWFRLLDVLDDTEFLTGRGAFRGSDLRENVGFHVVPGRGSSTGKVEGGGRYNFQTNDITFKSRGQTFTAQSLEPGDRIEFKVVAFSDGREYQLLGYKFAKHNPARKVGESEARHKEVVTFDEWDKARKQREQQEDRLKELKKQQEGVKPGIPTSRNAKPPVAEPGFGPAAEIAIICYPERWTSATMELLRRKAAFRRHSEGGFSC